jgi:hypothetical protein
LLLRGSVRRRLKLLKSFLALSNGCETWWL